MDYVDRVEDAACVAEASNTTFDRTTNGRKKSFQTASIKTKEEESDEGRPQTS